MLDPSLQLTADCENEPVSTIGFIQSFGILFTVDQNLKIVQVSANIAQWLQLPPEEIVGSSIAQFLTPRQVESLKSFATAGEVHPLVPISTTFSNAQPQLKGNATAHRSDGLLVLELEHSDPNAIDNSLDLSHLLEQSLRAIPRQESTEQLLHLIAAKVQEFTSYDRVMIYKFHPDHHGEVLVDICAENMESYSGFHFPASDIPEPARKLFSTNWTRIITNIDEEPIPLVPQFLTNGKPLDLTHSVLRQPAAVHIEYLKNMGVAASLTISLLVDGQLWGLIACHHRSPKYVNYWLRSICEFVGKFASLHIAKLQLAEKNRSRAAIETLCAKLFANENANVEVLLRDAKSLLQHFDANAIAFVAKDKIISAGSAPPEPTLKKLAQWLEEEAGGQIYSTESLDALAMDSKNPTDSQPAGLLSAPIYDGWLMIMRREFNRELTWGGDPNKTAIRGDDGKIHPRNSFSAWRTQTAGQSLPWYEQDRAAIETLVRVTVTSSLTQKVRAERTLNTTNIHRNNLHKSVEVSVELLRSQLQEPDLPAQRKKDITAAIEHHIALLDFLDSLD